MSDTVTVELTPAKATVVATGTIGPSGVVVATPPATYDPATHTVGVALGSTVGTAAAGEALADEITRASAQELLKLVKTANLSDLASAVTARTNLGLGTAATHPATDFDTPTARDAAITTAVTNLINGSPGALDTLNELATALGDDANFSATVTAALGNRLLWRGAWVAATAYAVNDLVTFNGGLYRAPTAFTSGGSFVLANWVQLVPQSGTYVPTTDKAAAGGVATLDGTTKIPVAQIPDLSATYAAMTTKRVTAAITGPNVTNAAVAVDYLQRMIVSLPVTTTRWRIKAGNRNLLADTDLTTPITLSDFYRGTPVYSSTGDRRWTGAFSSAPSLAVAGGTVPTDGTDWTSAWVTDAALQFTKNQKYLLSWAAVITNSGTGFGASPILGANHNGSGTANIAALAPAVTIGTSRIWADLRIEYEYATSEPVGLFIGDSITMGVCTAADPGSTMTGAFPHEAWPAVAGRFGGFAVANLAVGASGLTLSPAIYDTLAHRWTTRADLATTLPDFAVIALGTNDLSGLSLSSMQSAFMTLLDLIRGLGIHRVYAATIMPRFTSGYGWLGANVAVSDTSCVIYSDETTAPATTAPMTIGSGPNAETVTISARSGTGPWTCTVSAFTKAHTGAVTPIYATERAYFAAGGPSVWADFNSWLRGLPGGLAGVIDLAHLTQAQPKSPYPDQRFFGTDMLHPVRGGYQLIGKFAASIEGPTRV